VTKSVFDAPKGRRTGYCSAKALAAPPGNFYLHDGDRVVFYGDSITDQRLYTTFVETYVITRFPQMKVSFVHSGVGGDRVTGGGAGAIDVRLPSIDCTDLAACAVGLARGGVGYYRGPDFVHLDTGGYRSWRG